MLFSFLLVLNLLKHEQKLEKKDAEAEKNNPAGVAHTRQAPKKPRKTAANNSSSGTEVVKTEAAQKKANGGPKRAPAKKVTSFACLLTVEFLQFYFWIFNSILILVS